MFNVGGGEVLVIGLIALIVIGPEQLPGVLRKAGQYASQIRSMTQGFRQEFMSGIDEVDPTKWGTGEPDKPVVPRGYAERKAAGELDNPFKSDRPASRSVDKPVSAAMSDAEPVDEDEPQTVEPAPDQSDANDADDA